MERPARGRRWAYLFAFLVVAGFLTVTYSSRRITDTELNSFQTRALVRHGDVNLDRYPRVSKPAYFTVRRGEQVFRIGIERGGRLYSIYGVGISVMAAPVYAVATRITDRDTILQAAGAIPFVAGAIVLMYVLLARLVRPALAAAGTLVFGFGTTMWPLASMALYQHGPVALFQILGLLGFLSERKRGPLIAGLGFGGALLVRPPVAIPFAVVGLFYLTRGWRKVAAYAAGAAVPVAGILIQNRWIWGGWLDSGYSQSGIGFNANMRTALWGLLFGQWRGIFIYSPVLILGLVGLVMALRRVRDPLEQRLAVLGVSVVGTILFYSTWTTWWNGLNQFGYRYLLDVVPFLVVLTAYTVSRTRRFDVVAIPFAILSVLTMTWGAVPNNFGLDSVKFPKSLADASIGQAWIVFLDQPWWGLLRLAGVAAIGAMFLRLGRTSAASQPPLFESLGEKPPERDLQPSVDPRSAFR